MERFLSFAIQNSKFEGERENIAFGLKGLKLLGINIFTTIILGKVFNLTFEILVFLLAFMFIRSYAGGYHCKKALSCYLMSNSIIILVLVIIQYVSFESIAPFFIPILAIALFILYKYAPLETENKPLDEDERKYFRKKAMTNIAIELVLLLILYCFNLKRYVFIISLAIILSSILVVMQLMNTVIHKSKDCGRLNKLRF